MKIKNSSAFTLIELMITIAIIGILSLIAIPNYLSYKQKSYDAIAMADAKNFYLMAISNAEGESDITYNQTNLPEGFTGTTILSGNFLYKAINGDIETSIKFKHPKGKSTYSLDKNGKITKD